MKQDLRIVKTHKALCDTFMEMLCERSFEDITVNDLCERAMIRRATFYKHFADKYDFFSFFIRETRSQLFSNMSENYDASLPNAYYINLYKEFIGFLEKHKALVNSVVNSSVFPTLLNILSDEIQRDILLHLQEEKEMGHEFPMPLTLLSAFYAGGIIQISRCYLSTPNTFTADELVQNYAAILNYHDSV